MMVTGFTFTTGELIIASLIVAVIIVLCRKK